MGPERAVDPLPRAVPGAARWAITAIFAVDGAVVGTWAARVPALQERAGVSTATLGLALAGLAAGALVAMPISGWRTARDGSRRTTLACVAAIVVALPIPALATGAFALVLGAVALGAANGGIDVAMNAHGVEVERRLGRPILSSLHAGFSLGGLIGAGAGALVAGADVDVRIHFAAMALVLAAVALAAAPRLLPGDADAAPPGGRLALPPRGLWPLGAIAFCCMLAEGAAADWSAVYIDGPLGAGAATAALGFTGFSVAMTASRLAGDRLTARAGAVRMVRAGALLATAGLGAALLIAEPAAAVAGFACLGVGVAVVVPTVFRAAGTGHGVAAGTALAAVATAGYSGFLIGPPVIGAIAAATSLPAALTLVLAATLLVAALAPRVAGIEGEGAGSPGAAAAT
jgi:predicted MFS family arabinose efflux permease